MNFRVRFLTALGAALVLVAASYVVDRRFDGRSPPAMPKHERDTVGRRDSLPKTIVEAIHEDLTPPDNAAPKRPSLDEESRRRLVYMGEQLARADLQTALGWLAALEDPVAMERVVAAIGERLPGDSPGTIADLIAALPPGAAREDLLGRQVGAWSEREFDDALSWARQLHDGPVKAQALIHLSYRWQGTNVHEALAYAYDVRDTAPQLLTVVATQWGLRQPQAAAAWAAQIPDDASRIRVVASLTAAWARTAPHDAARYAASLPAGEAQVQAVTSALSGWASRNPAQAAEWAGGFAPGSMQVNAYAHVAQAWAQRDAAAGGEWLMRLPESPARDVAVSTFTKGIVERYPAIAFTLAESISGDAMRHERLEQAARRLLRTAPEDAARAIADSSLPASAIARLLRTKL